MSHTNKWHILYLIVVFYSWFLSSLSKCLHLRQKVPFPQTHSTNTSLTLQLNLTSVHRDKKAKTIWAEETELQLPGPESFPGVDAWSPHKRPPFNTLVCVPGPQRRTRYHLWLIHYSNRHQKAFLLHRKYRSDSCVSNQVLHTEAHWGKSRDHLCSFFILFSCQSWD